MELLNTHAGRILCWFFMWLGGGGVWDGCNLLKKKNLTSCIISGRVVMCFLVLPKLCFAAGLGNGEDA